MSSFLSYITLNVEGVNITAAYEPDSDGIVLDEVYVNKLDDPYTAVPYFTDKEVEQFVNCGTGLDDELDDLEPIIYGMAMARMERVISRAIDDDEDLVLGEIERAVIEEGR